MLKPTIHVEALAKPGHLSRARRDEIRTAVARTLHETHVAVRVGEKVFGLGSSRCPASYSFASLTALANVLREFDLSHVGVTDYTGPESSTGFYNLEQVDLDVQVYVLRDVEPRRKVQQADNGLSQVNVFALPSASLQDEWDSLVFDEGLPTRLLRYLVRMTSLMAQPGLKTRIFNWNRLCLLHGPPGSGKSTLCRALAQKLSIRMQDVFGESSLVEINANAMLSKYFGESGRLISTTFDGVVQMAQDRNRLVCVIIDEVETIAGSRESSVSGNECRDGLRATNQLLTALDRLRTVPNVLVLCTSNMIETMDPAFLDRVDIKQAIPCPSPAAVYNIFRSCLNELIRSRVVEAAHGISSQHNREPASSPEEWQVVGQQVPAVPGFSETMLRGASDPDAPGWRVWNLAQSCKGLSGRTLRRLPLLGLTMYTWGNPCTLEDVISALATAIDQEMKTAARKEHTTGVAAA